MRLYAVITSVLLGLGVGAAGGGCSPDFAPASQLGDSPQVLAVRAEPPVVAPGESVRLDALVHWPGDAPWDAPGDAPEYLWLVCRATMVDTIDTCVSNRLGTGGVMLPPCATAPSAALCYASRDATAVYTVDSEIPLDPDGTATIIFELVVGDDVDSEECLRAYRDLAPSPRCLVALKRLTVSAEARNESPALLPLEVDGQPADATDLVAVDSLGEEGDDLAVMLSVSVAPHTVDELDGDDPPDEAWLPVAWYTTCGGFDEDTSNLVCQPPQAGQADPVCDPVQVKWKPETSGECAVHVTVCDGRGGVAWITQRFVVGSGS